MLKSYTFVYTASSLVKQNTAITERAEPYSCYYGGIISIQSNIQGRVFLRKIVNWLMVKSINGLMVKSIKALKLFSQKSSTRDARLSSKYASLLYLTS